MTFLRGATLASTLSTSGTSNNPVIAWDNLAASGTVTTDVGTEQSDGAAVNAVTGTTYDYWSAEEDTGEVCLQIVFGDDQDIGFAAIAAHNLGALGATVEVQYSTDAGSNWTTVAAGSSAPTDDQAIAWHFTEVSADYWRLRITGLDTDAIASVGVFFLGVPLVVERRLYQGYTPPLTPTEVVLQSNVSSGGHLLGSSTVFTGSRTQAQLNYLTPAFVRGDDWLSFQQHFNAGGGFFWAWRPEKYGDLFYAWREGNPIIPSNAGPKDLMAVDLQMRLYHG